MPTGYTSDLYNGKDVSFADFALSLARAMMPMILLRDSDQSLEYTKKAIREERYAGGSKYERDSLAIIEERLRALRSMTLAEVKRAERKQRDEAIAYRTEYVQKQTEMEQRYRAMLAEVEAWTPPTDDHVRFKDFMREQLEQSLAHDITSYRPDVPSLMPGDAWRKKEIESLEKRERELHERLDEEASRFEARKQWIDQLVESLGGEEILVAAS